MIDGSTAIITGSDIEKLDETILVYNLEVADFNTYFVGDVPVLVHNYSGSDESQLPKRKQYDENQQAVIELAKEAKKAGKNGNPIKLSEANILLEWAEEYGIPHHGPEIHPNRTGQASNVWHFHIAKIGHILIDMIGEM